MKQRMLIRPALGLMIAGMSFCTAAVYAAPNMSAHQYLTQKRDGVKPVRPYMGKKVWNVDALNEASGKLRLGERGMSVKDPAETFEGLKYFDYLEAPDGSAWFYDATYEIESKQVSEWYTEQNIVSFTFNIYDENFNKIGSITDKITLNEDETKVASAVLDPAVSFNFFNQDANPEVMVYIAVNTLYYTNNYYNKVYSIGGEKDAEGNDVAVATITGRCVDAFNAAAPGEPENYYYTFVGEQESEDLDADYDNFVDFINSYFIPVTTYTKAVDAEGPKELYTKMIYMSRMPGDTTDGIYFISKSVNGKAYFIYSQYEKPYFIDPTGGAENEEATPDNSLIIDVVMMEGTQVVPVSTTKIPVAQEPSTDQLMYTFYSIGSVAWKDDVDMSVNGSTSAPAFLVARDVMNAATYEEVVTSYEIFGNDGNFIKEIASDTDGIMMFDNLDNSEPTALFIIIEKGNYKFIVRNIYSGKDLFTLNQDNGGDPISANCNRMLTKNGYKYGFEMTYYSKDEESNEYMRVAWFNNDGKLDRIDKINMGPDVMAGSVNLYTESLNPYIYDDDDAMEYAVLVKRTNGFTTKNEFIVADDNGEWYANFSEADGKGIPRVFTILPGETNHLMMVYDGTEGYNIDIYELPFLGVPTSVDSIGNDLKGISFTGDLIIAEGCTIGVYSTAGASVASGTDTVSVANLSNGIYVVVAIDSNGDKTVAKIMKR